MNKLRFIFLSMALIACGSVIAASEATFPLFGQFDYGDNLDKSLSTLCAIESIEEIRVDGNWYNKNDICQLKEKSFQELVAFIQKKTPGSFIFAELKNVERVQFDGLDIIKYLNFRIQAKPVLIKNVAYEMELDLSTSGSVNPIAAYVGQRESYSTWSNKKSSVVIPLFLHDIELKPLDKVKAKATEGDVFDLLQAKYKNYQGYYSDKKHSVIVVNSYGTKLKYSGGEIRYDGRDYLLKKYNELKDDYVKKSISQPTVKDSGSSL